MVFVPSGIVICFCMPFPYPERRLLYYSSIIKIHYDTNYVSDNTTKRETSKLALALVNNLLGSRAVLINNGIPISRTGYVMN